MRKHLLGLVLIAGLAGCSSESDPGSIVNSEASTGLSSIASVPTPASLAAVRGASAHFASLPDRGELLSYGGVRKVRQSGAYTYHPVAISEAHALNAIGSGEMAVNMPDGKTLRLAYERHEEQPDGNWTWIGRSADGSSAVLTFGEKAVFGMVSRGDDYFRVRTDRTGAWVVATDRSRAVPGGGKRGSEPDFLLPPETAVAAAAATRRLAKNGEAKAVTEKAVPVVDVLIGYSNGLATTYGSAAAAATFVTSLVAMTNAAYANSGVTMRLRAVHTLQVNYADTSTNRDTLQQMTGYNVDTQQPITPNAAFNALRAARNEYGADLVAFVRQYREPEQNGCGIAWLLGMNQSAISAATDAEFGYAVVSDGEDRDEGDNNTYFCSDYSLAHELGHLMGQAHNVENAGGDSGAHAYSYGYREASASGFFTIMAYPSGDAQVEAPLFANPSVSHAGRPSGTANADNVRSMNQTMPIVSTFRAAVVPLPYVENDFNNDGRSDILWRNTSNGQNATWLSGNSATSQMITAVALNWRVVGTGDFNGDGRSDILWRNMTNGQNATWLSSNSATSQMITGVSLDWRVAGIGDFNGDGRSDILWRNMSNGQNATWLSGDSATSQLITAVVLDWQVAGLGDFNGDGRSDILWRNTLNGQNAIWLSGNSATQQAVTTVILGWRVVGTGDFNGDGRSDILWRHTNGQNAIWLSANSATQKAISTVGVLAWSPVSVGDFNGDGVADILWRHATTGENAIWLSGDSSTQMPVTTVPGPEWQVQVAPLP
ncbi:MAG TPA: FG-GAP-like repeat-containing protein [Luteimonas sp.]|nr:FG-GAP-like repeat-containing protein [Luteimonas sp.]